MSIVEMQVVDADGDGDVDIIASSYQESTLLSNDGAGRFTRTELGEESGFHAVDLDGDGDLDLLQSGAPASWWERTGDGFAPVRELPFDVGEIAVGDIDGDGDVDVVRSWSQVAVVRRDGPDSWSDPVPLSLELCDGEIEDASGWQNEDTEGCAPGESDAIGADHSDDADEVDGCGCATARPAAPAAFALLVLVGLSRRRDPLARRPRS
jgi:MYXO-CTERM domain-containing protein